jgi:hypothetical protein
VRAFGLEALTRELSIVVTEHRDHRNLFHLCADKLDSPQDDSVVRECAYGLVLELLSAGAGDGGSDSAEEWRVVVMPYGKFFSHYRVEALPTIDHISWPHATGTPRPPAPIDRATTLSLALASPCHVSCVVCRVICR